MTAVFSLTSTSSNLLSYFETEWSPAFNASYSGNGEFYPASNPHSQWGAGDPGDYGVVLNGDFSYSPPGVFSGTLDDLNFGSSYSNNGGSGPLSVGASPDLNIDFGGSSPTSSFTEAVYSLSHTGNLEGGTFFGQQFAGFYDVFAETGTEQNGTSGADVLYSFEGDDTLTGNSGDDAFIFDLNGLGLLDDPFTTIGDDTVTDFNVANETIWLGGLAGYDDFSDLSITNSGGDAFVDLGGYGSITVAGVSASALDAGNFVFV